MFNGFGSYSAFSGGEFSIYRRERPQEQRAPEPEPRKQRAPEPPRQRPEPVEVPMAPEASPKAVERKAVERKAPESKEPEPPIAPKAQKTPRLKVIADALNPPQETKSRKSTVMSVLWRQAKDKHVIGYNRMTRAQLEAAIGV